MLRHFSSVFFSLKVVIYFRLQSFDVFSYQNLEKNLKIPSSLTPLFDKIPTNFAALPVAGSNLYRTILAKKDTATVNLQARPRPHENHVNAGAHYGGVVSLGVRWSGHPIYPSKFPSRFHIRKCLSAVPRCRSTTRSHPPTIPMCSTSSRTSSTRRPAPG